MAAAAQPEGHSTPMSSPVKFLLVDDIEDNLELLTILLEREGVELLCARSGVEALELLLVHDFALAIIDVQMPEMDGFELAELMRGSARSRHLPIIFATASRAEQHRLFKGYESGAVDFLFKPLDLRVLRHKTDVFMQLARQRQALAEQVVEKEKLLAQMRETLRTNEVFVSAVGSDLRAPLADILQQASEVSGPEVSESSQNVARRIVSSAGRMSEMIEELLDLARIRQAGGVTITRGPLDLRQLTERILGELETSMPRQAAALACSGDLRGSWDEGRLGQLLANLLSNALRHGRKGGPVQVTLDGRAAHEVTLHIHNQGAIPAATLAHVFDPFHSSKKSSRTGLGLGLYIVQQIAVAHQGQVTVQSSEADGTRFTVVLPRQPTGQTVSMGND